MSHLHDAIQHKVKILCTMGPAIATEAKIVGLVRAGANAFRLNMSHGSYTTHESYIKAIRAAEEKLGMHLPIVADLQGPKIRVADFKDRETMNLITGREIRIADVAVIRAKKLPPADDLVPVTYATLATDVKKGDALLLDDGLMKVVVREVKSDIVRAQVVNGGVLKPRKGINLPNVDVSQPAMTAKDRTDIRFAIEHDVDYIALSFVRTANDVENMRRYITRYGGNQWVIAKIEKPEALSNIEAIVDASDGIMVARGDLGVEIPPQTVPVEQKKIIKLCNAKAKPVITATQMLESMIHNPRPTRAEASDVANAVLDGTDVVMLSAETSVGAYPTDAVHMMRTICSEAERELVGDGLLHVEYTLQGKTESANTLSIARAAAQIADEGRLHGIACLSYSGETARLISNVRPRVPIIAVTTQRSAARRMQLLWGVTGMVVENITTTDETIEHVKGLLVSERMLPLGSLVVFTIGRPLVGRARTNMLSIETL
jgi:pyruvate kinase